MNIIDVIGRASRSLKSAKTRTVLTSLAIAVGGFTLTATLAAGNGMRSYTDRLVASNFDPSELIVGRDAEVTNTGTPNSAPKEYDESIGSLTVGGNGTSLQLKQVTDSDVAEIKKLDYVERVRENYQIATNYITRENQKRYTLSSAPYNPAQKPEIVAGELPADGDLADGYIALPGEYVSVLGFADNSAALGQEVSIAIREPFTAENIQSIANDVSRGGQISESDLNLAGKEKVLTYKVAAITKKTATSLNFGSLPVLFSEKDSRQMYDYTVKGTNNYGKYVYVSIKVKNGTDANVLKNAQEDLKARGYFTQSSKEIQQSITQIVNILQVMVGVFGLITIIASVFGIVNTQYISVLERTREIGLMKALGMRSRDVRRLFMIEAGWIGFLGGLIGAVIAFVAGTAMNPWISRKLEFGDGNKLLIFNIWQVMILIIALVVVAILAGFMPARKASKLDPIKALRTE